ncbi:hypothetical protein ACTQ5F_05565, partial [Jeotgalibaca porci]|uniref:hypothetical protein n=1 Tax=Jeotgalibaca porci TaxID=1868793 RepID=UPI003F907C5A
VLCGNLIIGVHGPFLSLKTEKVPVNHFDSPTLFTIEPNKKQRSGEHIIIPDPLFFYSLL